MAELSELHAVVFEMLDSNRKNGVYHGEVKVTYPFEQICDACVVQDLECDATILTINDPSYVLATSNTAAITAAVKAWREARGIPLPKCSEPCEL